MNDDFAILPPDEAIDVSLFDESDPTSLVNLAWPTLSQQLKEWPKDKLHFFMRPEAELRDAAKPDPTLNLVRVRFWEEHLFAVRRKKRMLQMEVLRGVAPREYWGHHVVHNLSRIAFVCTPPIKYVTRVGGLLEMGLERFGKILMNDSEDPKVWAIQLKIVEFLHPIVKGPVTQKLQIDQRVLTQNIDTTTDIRQIDQSLHQVQRQLKKAEVVMIDVPKERETNEV